MLEVSRYTNVGENEFPNLLRGLLYVGPLLWKPENQSEGCPV